MFLFSVEMKTWNSVLRAWVLIQPLILEDKSSSAPRQRGSYFNEWVSPHSLNCSFWLLKSLLWILSIQYYLVYSCELVVSPYIWNFSILKTKAISYFSYTHISASIISLSLCLFSLNNKMISHFKKSLFILTYPYYYLYYYLLWLLKHWTYVFCISLFDW